MCTLFNKKVGDKIKLKQTGAEKFLGRVIKARNSNETNFPEELTKKKHENIRINLKRHNFIGI